MKGGLSAKEVINTGCLLILLTLKVLVTTIHQDKYVKQDNYSTVGGDGGCRASEVRASTTCPMPDHKGFRLQ